MRSYGRSFGHLGGDNIFEKKSAEGSSLSKEYFSDRKFFTEPMHQNVDTS